MNSAHQANRSVQSVSLDFSEMPLIRPEPFIDTFSYLPLLENFAIDTRFGEGQGISAKDLIPALTRKRSTLKRFKCDFPLKDVGFLI